VIVVEGLQPEVPVFGVDNLVEEEHERVRGAGGRNREDRSNEVAQILPQQKGMVEPQPPQSPPAAARREKMPHGLVHHGGLAYAARAEDQVEPARLVVEDTGPEQLPELALDWFGENLRHLSGAMPRVLFVEDPLKILGSCQSSRQRGAPFPDVV
jgi:hypothetical protein